MVNPLPDSNEFTASCSAVWCHRELAGSAAGGAAGHARNRRRSTHSPFCLLIQFIHLFILISSSLPHAAQFGATESFSAAQLVDVLQGMHAACKQQAQASSQSSGKAADAASGAASPVPLDQHELTKAIAVSICLTCLVCMCQVVFYAQ